MWPNKRVSIYYFYLLFSLFLYYCPSLSFALEWFISFTLYNNVISQKTIIDIRARVAYKKPLKRIHIIIIYKYVLRRRSWIGSKHIILFSHFYSFPSKQWMYVSKSCQTDNIKRKKKRFAVCDKSIRFTRT